MTENIQRHYAKDLAGLNPNGAPCEVCKKPMSYHEWVDLDSQGFVVRCNFYDTASVILFRLSGKYYTEERWRIPKNAIGPYDMKSSPDFRTIGGGPVLVVSQEPWGFPHLLV
jgi:hypothetical protein